MPNQATLAHQRTSALGLRLGPAQRTRVAAWALGFAAPMYLALRGGGYETVLRDQVGVAVWWIVLVGVGVGVLSVGRPSRTQLSILGALVAFAAWTGLGALWSLSAGPTVSELSLLSGYAAVFALAVLTVQAGGRSALVGGVACASSLVAVLALLSRLHPAWFPANETAAFLPETRSRLDYPLNYWNALATFTAIGLPLLLHFATSARRTALRALSAAAIPAMVGTLYLTFSRGGWIETGAAVIVYLALAPRRARQLVTLALAGGGGALLIAAIHQRPAVDKGLLNTAAAHSGGNELIVVALFVCVGVGLVEWALALAGRHQLAGPAPGRMLATLTRRPAALLASTPWRVALGAAVVAVVAVAFLVGGGPHAVSDAWREFKTPVLKDYTSSRLTAVSGEGRYQYWVAAVSAFTSHPLGGIGAGAFQFWWAAHGSIYSYVINAHSLYFETLADTGVIGVILLALVLFGTAAGILKRWRGASVATRGRQAAVAGTFAAFLVAAGVDWVWQIPAIPVAVLLLVAAATTRSRPASATSDAADPAALAAPANRVARADAARSALAGSVGKRAAWMALAAVGTAAIVVPMASAISLRESQAAARAGHPAAALAHARTAAGWEPYAAEPPLQQALLLEQNGNLAAASAKARAATAAAKNDWSAWLTQARIEAERGDTQAALAAWNKARSLDPHDPLFAH